jgi:hypothetical protein
MKQIFILLVSVLTLVSCESSNQRSNVIVTAETPNLGNGLDLQALGEIVKNSTSAQEVENKLNQPNSINNLDLDGDGQVDYIKVTEYGSGSNRGFSFTVDTNDGSSQEIASVEINRVNNQQANMSIHGNQNIYGHNSHYSSSFGLTDLLILNYLFNPHPVYVSPWRYGYYPNTYRRYTPVAHSNYTNRVSSTTRTTKITRTTVTKQSSSPNKHLSSASVNARTKSLAAPTTSQKSFTKTSTSNSRPNTSGFKSSTSSSSKPLSTSSSSSRSGGFGSSSKSSYTPSKSSSSWGSSSSSKPKSSSSWGSSSSSKSSSSFGSSSRSSSSSSSRSGGFGSSSRSSSSSSSRSSSSSSRR